MNASHRVYRAPYVYLAQSHRAVKIGHTLRPPYELQRLRARHGDVHWLCGIRAYGQLAPILWQRFAYTAIGKHWFTVDRRIQLLAEQFAIRDPEQIITPNQLRGIFLAVFPESPYVGIAAYRMCETYLQSVRHKSYTG